MTYKENCKEAQKEFEERGHQAKLVIDNDDITVINWINGDGSSDYYVRYILSRTDHRQNIYLSGDLGDAVFEMFWSREDLTIAEIARLIPENNVNYLIEKLKASSDKYVYPPEATKSDLRDYLIDQFDNGEDLEAFIEEVMEHHSYFNGLNEEAYDSISEYDSDCFEWIGHCGRRISFRCYLWVVGLIMACRQLAKEEVTK